MADTATPKPKPTRPAAAEPTKTKRRRAVNPLELSSGDDYDPAKFYTRSTNKHDHAQTLHTPMPQDVYAECYKWAELVPEYKGSAQALARDAVHHRLRWLREQYDPGSAPREFELMAEQDRLMEISRRHKDVIDKAQVEFKDLIEMRDTRTLARSIELYREIAREMDDAKRGRLEALVDEAEKQLAWLK